MDGYIWCLTVMGATSVTFKIHPPIRSSAKPSDGPELIQGARRRSCGVLNALRDREHCMSSLFQLGDSNVAALAHGNCSAEVVHQHHAVSSVWIDRPTVIKELDFIDSAAESKDGDKALKALLRKVLDGSDQKRFVTVPTLKAVRALAGQFPNFAQVVKSILGELALQLSASAKPRRLTPLLLLGEPGIGKTQFAQSLASQLGVAMELVSLGTATSGFALAGMDRGWGSAHQGKIFNTLLRQNAINPLIVLDEVDKAGQDSKSDPLGPLYQLLEEETAKGFVDEFVQVPINASLITWLLTANDEANIPSPLLSRMRVFHIRPPTAQEMTVVVENQYRKLRESFPALVEKLPLDVLSSMCRLSPRQAGLELKEATGRAALRSILDRSGIVKVQAQDVGQSQHGKRSIGFT